MKYNYDVTTTIPAIYINNEDIPTNTKEAEQKLCECESRKGNNNTNAELLKRHNALMYSLMFSTPQKVLQIVKKL